MGQPSSKSSPSTSTDVDTSDLTFYCVNSPSSSGFIKVSVKSLVDISDNNNGASPILNKELSATRPGMDNASAVLNRTPKFKINLTVKRDSPIHASLTPTSKKKLVKVNDTEKLDNDIKGNVNTLADSHDVYSSIVSVAANGKRGPDETFMVTPLSKKARFVISNDQALGEAAGLDKIIITPTKHRRINPLPKENIASTLRRRSVTPARRSCVCPTPRSGTPKIKTSNLEVSIRPNSTPGSSTPKRMSRQVSTPKPISSEKRLTRRPLRHEGPSNTNDTPGSRIPKSMPRRISTPKPISSKKSLTRHHLLHEKLTFRNETHLLVTSRPSLRSSANSTSPKLSSKKA